MQTQTLKDSDTNRDVVFTSPNDVQVFGKLIDWSKTRLYILIREHDLVAVDAEKVMFTHYPIPPKRDDDPVPVEELTNP